MTVEYYSGNSSCPVVQRTSPRPDFHVPFEWKCGGMPTLSHLKMYPSDMDSFCKSASQSGTFRVWFGDAPYSTARSDSFTFTKVRLVQDRCGILLPLNMKRHWGFGNVDKLRSLPWSGKIGKLVWRGSTTGVGLRRDFVRSLSPRHDVCFDKVVEGRRGWISNSSMLCGRLPLSRLLAYKYVLVLPGNDVATSLKWALASSSLVLMPIPVQETWLMEGRLLPWQHFLPVQAPADVPAALEWLSHHDKEAQDMVRNANSFVDSVLKDMLAPIPALFRVARSRLESAPSPFSGEEGVDE